MKARCPGHDDHIPSLIVAVDEDKNLVLMCLAGCTLDQIMRGLKKLPPRFLKRKKATADLIASGTEYLTGAADGGSRYYRGKA